jgi:antitoxin component of RelBE/YafQ-DinJ toxin-antitoxin module
VKKAVIIVRLDEETKTDLKDFAEELGLTMSSLINGQIKMLLRDGKIYYSNERRNNFYLMRRDARRKSLSGD